MKKAPCSIAFRIDCFHLAPGWIELRSSQTVTPERDKSSYNFATAEASSLTYEMNTWLIGCALTLGLWCPCGKVHMFSHPRRVAARKKYIERKKQEPMVLNSILNFKLFETEWGDKAPTDPQR